MEQLQPVATSKTKRYLVTAAVLGGGMTLGAIFSPIGLADAQTDDGDEADPATADSTDAPESDDDADTETDDADGGTDKGDRHRRGPRAGGRLDSLDDVTGLLGLAPSELGEKISEGQTLAEIAAEQGVAEEDLVAALMANAEERVDDAVANGRLDADEAAERLSQAEEHIEALIDGTFEGGFGRGGHHRGSRAHGFAHKAGFGEVAESLGISEEALEAGRAEGKSLAEVAAEQGVAEQDLIDALVAGATEAIDEAVAEGNLDDERAKELKANLAEGIAERIDNPAHGHDGDRGGRGGHHEPRGRGFGPGADRDADADSDADVDGETEESSYTA